jgi:hypothetical protein
MGALLVGLLVGSGLAVLLAGWAGLAVTVVVWRWVSGGRSLVA